MSLYSGYVRCISMPDGICCYTAGKVYKICNGKLFSDLGIRTACGVHTFEDLQLYSSATWEELELVNCCEYNIGDWVLVQNHRGLCWNEQGDMDCFMNKVCKVTKKLGSDSDHLYCLDDAKWFFDNDDFVGALMPKKLADSLKPTRSEPEKTCKECTR